MGEEEEEGVRWVSGEGVGEEEEGVRWVSGEGVGEEEKGVRQVSGEGVGEERVRWVSGEGVGEEEGVSGQGYGTFGNTRPTHILRCKLSYCVPSALMSASKSGPCSAR